MADADELSGIRRMMDEAQRGIEDNGKYFVAWGTLTVIGLVVTYVALTTGQAVRTVWLVWAALIAIGWGVALYWARSDFNRAPVRTITASMVADCWMGIGGGLTVLVFGGAASGTISSAAIPGLVATLMGSGAFASAAAYQLPLRLVGAVWWAGAAIMLIWPGTYTILLLGGLVVALLILPGIALSLRARRTPRVVPR